MLQIIKNDELKEFVQWKKKYKNKYNRKPNYDNLSEDPEMKKVLKQALLGEQRYLCCYCCAAIDEKNSHIEHFRPKGVNAYKGLQMDYQNLHACCMGEHGDRKHCGHVKKDSFDETLMISPLSEDCEEKFKFTMGGEILPADSREDAIYTIDILNLKDIRLQKARAEVMWMTMTSFVEPEERKERIESLSMRQEERMQPFSDVMLYQLKTGEGYCVE